MTAAPQFYDTHAHFDCTPTTIVPIMQRAFDAGVQHLMAVGGSSCLNAGACAVAQIYVEQTSLALGFDRDQTSCLTPEQASDTLRQLALKVRLSAIGEIGLDFHYHPETREAQIALFKAQLKLADEMGLPVIIHTRDAEEDTLKVLDAIPSSAKKLRGVVHCFTGDKNFAAQLLERDLAISFSGIVTFRNAEMLRESAKFVPEERLLIETDTPFLTPVPMRGQPNEPAFVSYVAACLAKVRGVTLEHIAATTTQNARRLFT